MKTTKKMIGILGGIGPDASANLYQKVLYYCQNKYGAIQDTDYPPMMIYSCPLEGFNETGITDEKLVKSQLIAAVKKLEASGCDLIIIACNTVHIYFKKMQEAVEIPIFNIVEETLKKVETFGHKKVGLLCSESTKELKLYQKAFDKKSVEIFAPDREQQKLLNQVIEHVMGGHQNVYDTIACKDIIWEMVKNGAESIVLGCTEIPLAINQSQTDVKIFDTIEIIVQSAINFSFKN